MIEVKVLTIDGGEERFTSEQTVKEVLEGLEFEGPTFVLGDEKLTIWFVKAHIIKVKIRCL